MTQILNQMTDAVGSFLSMPAVQIGSQLIAGYVVVLWLGAAFWAYRDMRRRTGDLLAPFASAGLVIVFTPLLFPAAFLVHLVMRPPETLEERSEHELRRSILESEAMGTICPTCATSVADDWLLCPSCATRLRRRCPACDRLVELTWDMCAFCGRDFRPEPAAVGTDSAGVAASPSPVAQPARRAATLLPRRTLAPTRSGGPHVRSRPAAPAPVTASVAQAAAMRAPTDG